MFIECTLNERGVNKMGSLYSINRRIANVDASISSAYDRMYERSEQLGRMRTAKSEFTGVRTDFLQERSQCTEPEFTASTFHGEQANKINNFRKDYIEESFFEIINDQMLEILSQINDEIDRLSDEVIELNDRITSLKNDRSTLIARRESELLKNG